MQRHTFAATIAIALFLLGAFGILASPTVSSAQTTDSDSTLLEAIRAIVEESVGALEAEVQSLRSEVSALRVELQSAQTGGGGGGGVPVVLPPPSAPPGVYLSMGDTGPDVRQLQEVLIRLGFDIPAGITGIFLSQTRDAVRELQRQYGIPVTGAFDEATREVLERLVGQQPISVPPPQEVEPDTPSEPEQPVITPQLRLISPQDNLLLGAGAEILISWNTTYAPAGAKVSFRLTNALSGARRTVYETEELSGTYTWALPSNMPSDNTFTAELLYSADADNAPLVLASRSVTISILGGTDEPASTGTSNTPGTTGGSTSYNDYAAFYTGSAFTTCMAEYPATIALIKSWLDDGLSRYQFPWGEITGAAANKVAECEGGRFSGGSYGSYGDCRNNASESACSAQPGCFWYGTYCEGDNYGGGGNWVNKTWNFVNGNSVSSSILNRTDSEYTTYINGVYNDCTNKYFAGWKPGAGNDSNWQEFGIPECSATDTGYVDPYSVGSGGGSSAQCSPGFHFEYYEGSSVICFSDGSAHDQYQVDQGATISCSTASRNGCPGTSGGGGGGGSGTSQMYSCFYPNATINGQAPGYTVWCEYDYQNCREGDPSGPAISTEGLTLGAPSTCESGWNGGSQTVAPGSAFLANVVTAVSGFFARIFGL